MKRISKRYLLIAILVLGLILSVGCMSIDFSFNDYKPEFPEHRPKELVKDEGFEIDGVLNEEIWATLDNEIRAQYSEDVYLTSKSYQGEKGVYFGITVKDFAIYYNPDRSISRNSSVEVYLSTFGKMKMDEYCVNLRVCPTDNEGGIYFESWIEDPIDPANMVKWYFEWEAAVTVQGIINTSECEGFTVEIFVPWSTLGVETAEYIQYYPAFNHVETDSVYESERTFVGIQGCRVHSPSTWITVNNGGVYNTYEIYNTYMKTDPEVVIDGKLDEDVWKGNQTIKYYRKDTDYSLEANSYITEKGIYIGITVEDKYIYYADTSVRPIGLNSGVELYIAPFGATSVTSNCLQLRITATGVYTTYIGSPTEPSYPWKQTPFPSKVATFIDGEVNAEDISENEGYTVEIYIPWFVMGVQNRDKFLLYPCLVHTENAELAEKVLPWTYTSTGSHSHFHDPTYDYFPMSKDGYVVSSIGVNDILLDSRNIEGDYYTAQFDVNIRYPEFIGANAMPVIRTIKASFAEVEDLEIEEGEQQYILKIHKDEISSFISGKSVQVSAYGVSTSFKVSYSPITVDGTVDEEVWAPNTHTTRNTTHGVTQTTNIYFGVSGLYLGYVVIDPRASDTIKDENGYTMTHLEVYLTVGDEVSVDTTFQFRLYTDGKYRSYNYRDASFPWTERTGSNLLPAVYAVKMTEDGYNCELFIPYSTLGVTGLTQVYLDTWMGFITDSGSVLVRDGDKNIGNSVPKTITNYDLFDTNGYVYMSVYVADIIVNTTYLDGGLYKIPFTVATDSSHLNKISGCTFSDDRIIETGNGSYLMTLTEEEVNSLVEGLEITVYYNNLSAVFNVTSSIINNTNWANGIYSSGNQYIMQTISTHFGSTGLYIKVDVLDEFDDLENVRVEIFLTFNGSVSEQNSYHFRLYRNGNLRTYNYTGSGTLPWSEKTGDNKLKANNEVQINDYGYTVALYIPYTTVGLIAVPEQFAIISVVFYGTSSSATTLSDYYNGTKFYNALVREYNEYLIFDENGYVEPVVTSEDAAVFIDFDNDVANSGKNGSINVSIVANKAKSTDFLPYTGTPVYETGNSETADDKALKINHLNGPNVCIEDYNFGLGDFTISGWFYLDPSTTISSGNSTYLFGAVEQPDSSRSIFVTLRKASGEYRIGFKQGNATSTNILTVGDMTGWHMYTLVRSSGTVKLYIDGVFISYKDNAAVDLGVTDIGIGSYYGTSWSYYNNDLLVDDFCVFDRALSIDEIKALMDYQSR